MGAPAATPGPAPLMRTPRTVHIDLTASCNLRCRYCYFFNNPAVDYRDLPTEEWLTFFAELGALKVMNVILAGGEPFKRPDLPALLEGIVRHRMRFALLSNGALIEEGIAAFIAATRRCDYVQVSVDGASSAAHDAGRGRGSFKGAVRGIRVLQGHGVPVTVRVTIHRHNVGDLDNIARLLLEELGLPSFSTNAAGYLGSCQRHADELLLTAAERQEAMAALLRLAARYPGRIQASAGPLAEGRTWARMEAARRDHAPPFANGGRLTGCGCPQSEITVRADGAIVPCSMLAHLELGRIQRDSLAAIWREAPALAALRARSVIPLRDFAFCAGCAYTAYCTGNCPGLAYALTGQVDHPSPDACLRRFLADSGRLDAILKPASPAAARLE